MLMVNSSLVEGLNNHQEYCFCACCQQLSWVSDCSCVYLGGGVMGTSSLVKGLKGHLRTATAHAASSNTGV
jgi:hypothetical protein